MTSEAAILQDRLPVRGGILLVDDDVAVLTSLRRALESENYTVRTAVNGVEALASLNRGNIDLALLDIDLLVTRSWEVLQQLTTYHPFLPVIVITAQTDQCDIAAAAGAAAIMEKPLSLPTLLELIDRLAHEPRVMRLGRLVKRDPLVLTHLSETI